jgi:predicted DNA-binding transcriptional regulator AlpA
VPDTLDTLPAGAAAPAASAPGQAPPLLVSRRHLAGLLSLSLPTIDRLAAAGKLPRPLRLAGSVRWRMDEIREWVAAGCPDRRTWEALSPRRTEAQA